MRFIKDDKSGQLIDVNALEYATVIINYAACYYYWVVERNFQTKETPYPKVLIKADNVASEFWAKKGCKRSKIDRRLGLIQCAMMINRFHPSKELFSLILDALLLERHVNPLEIMEVLRNYPGMIAP